MSTNFNGTALDWAREQRVLLTGRPIQRHSTEPSRYLRGARMSLAPYDAYANKCWLQRGRARTGVDGRVAALVYVSSIMLQRCRVRVSADGRREGQDAGKGNKLQRGRTRFKCGWEMFQREWLNKFFWLQRNRARLRKAIADWWNQAQLQQAHTCSSAEGRHKHRQVQPILPASTGPRDKARMGAEQRMTLAVYQPLQWDRAWPSADGAHWLLHLWCGPQTQSARGCTFPVLCVCGHRNATTGARRVRALVSFSTALIRSRPIKMSKNDSVKRRGSACERNGEPEPREAATAYDQRSCHWATENDFSMNTRGRIQIPLNSIASRRLGGGHDWPGEGSDTRNVFFAEPLLKQSANETVFCRTPLASEPR